MEFTEKEMDLLVESMKDVREHIMNEREHCEFVRPCKLKSEMSAMIAEQLDICDSILQKLNTREP